MATWVSLVGAGFNNGTSSQGSAINAKRASNPIVAVDDTRRRAGFRMSERRCFQCMKGALAIVLGFTSIGHMLQDQSVRDVGNLKLEKRAVSDF